MNPWRWVDPRVQLVRLPHVREYFQRHGWELKPNPNPELLRFEKKGRQKEQPLYQVFPSSDEFDNFPQRLTELITTLSEIENRHPIDVLNDMLAGVEAPSQNGPEKKRRVQAVRK